jgi:hypothetical protein
MLKFRSLAGSNLLRLRQKPCHSRRSWAVVSFYSLGGSVGHKHGRWMDVNTKGERMHERERERERQGLWDTP